MILIYLTIAWVVGIVVAKQAGVAPPFLAGCTLAGGLWALYVWRSRRMPGRGHAWLPAALFITALLGGWRYLLALPIVDASRLAYYNDTGRVTVQGFISADPSARATYTQLELSVEALERGGRAYPVRGKVVLDAPTYPSYEYGDILRVEGSLETPPILEDFSYKEYLAARGVGSLLRQARVTPLDGRQGSALLRLILRARRALRGVIEGALPNPEAGLLCGILLGLGHTLPYYLADAFRVVGLTHLIVISGYNISLVSQAVMVLSGRALMRWVALALSLVAIGLFTLFVGPSPPVVRAALMGGLFIGGQFAGRRAHLPTALAAASLFMTAWNPLLVWNISFQLSFAATLGLILLLPALEQRAAARLGVARGSHRAPSGVDWWRFVQDGLLVTLAAQLATLPILWYHFRQVSVVSLLANILVLPVQPAIMLFGFLAAMGGAIWGAAGHLLAWLAWPFLRYTIWVVQQLGSWSWAAIEAPHLPPLVIGGLYGGLAWWLLRSSFPRIKWPRLRLDWHKWLAARNQLAARNKLARYAIGSLVLAVVLVWSAVLALPDHRLHIYFLDVGQGDAILVRAPGGQVALVDGGPDPVLLTSRLGQVLPFWQRRVDLVVATHADQDHLSGLIPVGQRYQVGQALQPASLRDGALAAQWEKALLAAGVPVIAAQRGMRASLGEGVSLEVLHPPPRGFGGAQEEENRNSLVLRISQGACSLLLMADVDVEGEEELLRAGQIVPVTILKVGHHGSSSSSSARFLAAAAPQVAIISVGADNRFGHPTEEVLQRLQDIDCRVYRTDEQGTIEVITDGERYWIKKHGRRK